MVLVWDRIKLDRRRLEAAHLLYAILNVTEWYFGLKDKFHFTRGNLDDAIDKITPLYHNAFSKEYAGMATELSVYT